MIIDGIDIPPDAPAIIPQPSLVARLQTDKPANLLLLSLRLWGGGPGFIGPDDEIYACDGNLVKLADVATGTPAIVRLAERDWRFVVVTA